MPAVAGSVYDPALDTWATISTTGIANDRLNHIQLSTGTDMLVWGGKLFSGGGPLNTGASYSIANNNWRTLATTNAPAARLYPVGVWTGTEMLIWGGDDADTEYGPVYYTGARYNPANASSTVSSLRIVAEGSSAAVTTISPCIPASGKFAAVAVYSDGGSATISTNLTLTTLAGNTINASTGAITWSSAGTGTVTYTTGGLTATMNATPQSCGD